VNYEYLVVLAVIAWAIGALESVLAKAGVSLPINWLCAGLCFAGVGVWLG